MRLDSPATWSSSLFSIAGVVLQQGQCQFSKTSIGATQAGVVTIPVGSESDLQAATATAGPVSVAVDGSSNAFRVRGKGGEGVQMLSE